MKGELLYIYHPWRWRIIWTAVYLALGVGLVVGLWILGSRIRTHSVPTGQVQLVVPHSRYTTDESVTFVLKNNFNSTIYVQNNCPEEPLAVYRQENGKWVRIHDQAAESDCQKESRQVQIPAGGEVGGNFQPWHNLFKTPGKYRVVAFVEYYNAFPYQDFEIISPVAALPPPAKPSGTGGTSGSSGGSSTSATTPSTSGTSSAPPARQSKTITTSGGSLVAQYDSTTVYITSISPAGGCTYEGGGSGSSAQVTFICGETHIQVHLEVQGGQLVQQIETSD
jgi:hypothetical protein